MSEIQDVQSLRTFLELRRNLFKTMTEEIFKQVSSALSCAVNFYIKSDHQITWTNMDVLQDLPDFVRVTGEVSPAIGAIMQIDDTVTVTITESNRQQFKKILTFVIPIDLLEHPIIPLRIHDFIRDFVDISSACENTKLHDLLSFYSSNKLDKLADHPEYHMILDKATQPTEVLGFDVSHLSSDKIRDIYSYCVSNVTETKH